jgi:hypothetical protein
MAKHALRQSPPVKHLVIGLLSESVAFDVVCEALSPQKAMEAIFAQGTRVLTDADLGLAQEDLTAKWSDAERQQVVAFFQRNQRLAGEALRYEAPRTTTRPPIPLRRQHRSEGRIRSLQESHTRTIFAAWSWPGWLEGARAMPGWVWPGRRTRGRSRFGHLVAG